MDLLSSITAPTEGIVCQQDKTAACVGNNDLGQGCVFVTESSVTWLSDNGQGFTLNYPDISLHAISRDQNAFPKPCLYIMFDGKLDKSSDKESEEEEGERDPMPEVTEIRFIPDDVNSLEAMYSAMCDCQALHPDENDSLSADDDDDEYDGGYDEPVIVTASGDSHGDAFGNDDDGFSDELPHVGIVHGNGDAAAMDINAIDEDQFEDVDDDQ